MERKAFARLRGGMLAASGCALLLAAWLWHAAASTAERIVTQGAPDVCVVISNGGDGRVDGLARRATWIDTRRARSCRLVQVDTGDFVPESSRDASQDARESVTALARMGVDAAVPGERELSLGLDDFASLARSLGLPIVAANLLGPEGKPTFPPSVLTAPDPDRVGVFGVIELAPEQGALLQAQGASLQDPVDATRRAVIDLRSAGAKLVVGLFHVGGAARAKAIVDAAGVAVDVVAPAHASGIPDPGLREGTAALIWARPNDASVALAKVYVREGRTVVEPGVEPIDPATPEQIGLSLLARVPSLSLAARTPLDGGFPDLKSRREHWTYASTDACGYCHARETAQWAATPHAHALATLREAGRAGDPSCVGCHTTGFLRPGGTQYLDTAVAEFPDVGCEMCHGPSGNHVASADKKKGTSRSVDPALCFGCHTPDESTEPFDVVAAWKTIVGPGHGEGAVFPTR